MKEALSAFDLKKFKSWMEKYNKPLWNTFKKSSENPSKKILNEKNYSTANANCQ